MTVWSKNELLNTLVGQTQRATASTKRQVVPMSVPLKQVSYKPAKNQGLESAFRMQGIAEGMGGYLPDADEEYDWLQKAEELAYQTAQLKNQTAAERSNNATINLLNSQLTLPNFNAQAPAAQSTRNQPGKRNFQSFKQAIVGQESGGDYSVVNPDSGAAGKYQIMPSNLEGSGRGWDYEALGRDVSMRQFLNNPRLQDRIATYKLKQYYNQYGPRGAASAWYSGDPNKWKNTSSQGNYPTIAAYVQEIIRRMRG